MNGSPYQINNRLYESPETIIYRAYIKQKCQHVILKCLKRPSSSLKKSSFKREYEIINALNVEGMIQTYGIETIDKILTIVFEDFGGVSLQSYMKQHHVKLREAIEISIQLTEILGRIHDKFIIHNSIDPSNIIIHEQSKKTVFIDFGLAARFSQEVSGMIPLSKIKSNISYISPEQTGRLDRVIDCRSDYYSLGVTIYELLTGKRPFESDDEMEKIKKLLASPPPPITILRPDIPEVLSDIVLKLLSKLPEERYQSIQGIVYDLKKCAMQLKEKGKINSFPIGKHDIPKKLRISQKIYGRDKEINQLLNSFESICQGKVEMVVVQGPAGVGKTSLIREMYKPVTRANGFFIDGKFDQLQRDIPYSAFIQAFKQQFLFLLTEDKAIRDKWSTTIKETLIPNGQIMIDLIPELELIIGHQPEVPKIGPIEMKHRLYRVCQKLIKLFCQPEHPLTIFLDDLQWIDSSSLKLLEFIVTDPDIRYLLIIGAYSDNNDNLSHPLIRTFTQLEKKEFRITYLKLTNLSIANLTQLIEDSLYIKDNNIKALATYVKDKTDGNPIHSLELIKSLHSEQLLYFDNSDSQWKWDMQVINNQLIADNVVRILESRMKQLSPQTVHALKMASCLGNQFNLLCLSIVCEKSPQDIFDILYEAISERFLISLNVFYEIEAFENNQSAASNMEYRFTHDRVQEAAKNLIPIDESYAIHWRVGCLLRDNLPLKKRSQNIFTIISNLNTGVASVTNDILNESTELAKLNLEAGRKARASAAYPEYLKYLKFAKNLMLRMNEQCWKNQYQLMCDIYIEAAEAAYLSGNFDGMDLFVEHLEKNLKKNTEDYLFQKSRIKEIQILAYIAQNKLNEAIDFARSALKDLGFSLPKKTNILKIIYGLLKTKLWLNLYKNNFEHFEVITDFKKESAIKIILHIVAAVYISKPELIPILIIKIFTLLPRNGYSIYMGHALALYAVLLCGFGILTTGFDFGFKALEYIKHSSNDMNVEIKVNFFINDFIRHWHEHANKTLEPLIKTYQSGMEAGEIEYATCSLFVHSFFSFFIGKNLKLLLLNIKEFQKKIKYCNQETFLEMQNVYFHAVIFLTGHSKLTENEFFYKSEIPAINANNQTALCNYYISRLMICYLFREFNVAFGSLNKANEYIRSVFATFIIPLINFYDSLTRLSLYPSISKKEQKQFMKIVNANQKKMKKWQKHAPMNYAHKYFLIEAERFRVMKIDEKAINFYELAIKNARENEYTNEEAIANELAAKYYLETNQENIARIYMMDALYCYQEWGATAKVLDLKEQYPHLLKTFYSFDHYYSTSIIPALHAISNETDLSMLSNLFLKILIDKTSAQNAYVISIKEKDLLIEAQFTNISGDHIDQFPVLLDSSSCLSHPIVRYVLSRREPLILENACLKGHFVNDPYVQSRQIKSVLCTPVINENIKAIVYLENYDTGTFTKKILKSLQPLLVQASICFEKAILYEQLEFHRQKLEKQITQKTRQLISISQKNSIGEIISGLRHELQPNINNTRGCARKIKNYFRFNDLHTDESDAIDVILEQIESALQDTNNLHVFNR